MPDYEDDETFLRRRAEEERGKMKDTSCIVRAVHEDLAELYDERGRSAEADTAALDALAKRID